MDWPCSTAILPTMQTEFLNTQPATTTTVIPDLSLNGQIDRFAQQIQQNPAGFTQQIHQPATSFSQQVVHQSPVTFTQQQMYQCPPTFVPQQVTQAQMYVPTQEFIPEVVSSNLQDPTNVIININQNIVPEDKKCKKKIPRKRKGDVSDTKKPTKKRATTELEKQIARKLKHPILPVCTEKCRKKCPQYFTEEHRAQIHDHYWSLILVDRRQFLDNHISASNVKPRPKKTKKKYKTGDDQKRKHNLNYFLPTETNGDNKLVCKTMFLHTLGMRTDGAITEFVAKKLKTGIPEGTGASTKAIPPTSGSTPCVSVKVKKETAYHLEERTLTKEQIELLANLPSKRPRNEDLKRQIRQLKHAMLGPCNKCRRKCSEKIFDGQRSLINSVYWGSTYTERRKWLDEHISMVEIKERKAERLNRMRKKKLQRHQVDKKCKFVRKTRASRGQTLSNDEDHKTDYDEATDVEEDVEKHIKREVTSPKRESENKNSQDEENEESNSENGNEDGQVEQSIREREMTSIKSKILGRRPKMHLLCYTLPTSTGESITVCKTMFLHTLGLRTDGTISGFVMQKLAAANGDLSTVQDMRGRRTPKKEYDTSLIKQHIYSIYSNTNPQLSVRKMWKDFRSKGNKVSYEIYRHVCNLENISFRHPTKKAGAVRRRTRKPKQKTSDPPEDDTSLPTIGIVTTGLPQPFIQPAPSELLARPHQQQPNTVYFNLPTDGSAINLSTAVPVHYSFNKPSTIQPELVANMSENMVMSCAPSTVSLTTAPPDGTTVMNYTFDKHHRLINSDDEVVEYKPIVNGAVNYSFKIPQQATILTPTGQAPNTTNDLTFNKLPTEGCILYNIPQPQ